MPALVKTALNVTADAADMGAGVLDAVAGTLRGLAGGGEEAAEAAEAPEASQAPETPTATEAKPPVDRQHGERPAPGTRTRISNPKAARRARQR